MNIFPHCLCACVRMCRGFSLRFICFKRDTALLSFSCILSVSLLCVYVYSEIISLPITDDAPVHHNFVPPFFLYLLVTCETACEHECDFLHQTKERRKRRERRNANKQTKNQRKTDIRSGRLADGLQYNQPAQLYRTAPVADLTVNPSFTTRLIVFGSASM